MILELKDKAVKLGSADTMAGEAVSRTGEQVKDDALSALVNLGYRGSSAKETVDRIVKEATEPLSLDKILKKALRILAG